MSKPIWRSVLLVSLALLLGSIPGCRTAGEGEGAAETAPAADGTAPGGHLVATFVVPSLDETRTQVLVAALAENPGVITAQAVPDSGLFRVAFAGDRTSAAEVLTAVTRTGADISLREILQVEASAAAHACAGCPAQATCGGAH